MVVWHSVLLAQDFKALLADLFSEVGHILLQNQLLSLQDLVDGHVFVAYRPLFQKVKVFDML